MLTRTAGNAARMLWQSYTILWRISHALAHIPRPPRRVGLLSSATHRFLQETHRAGVKSGFFDPIPKHCTSSALVMLLIITDYME